MYSSKGVNVQYHHQLFISMMIVLLWDCIGVNNFQRSKVIDTIKPSVWLSVAKSISDETVLNGRIDCWKGGGPTVMIVLHICHI